MSSTAVSGRPRLGSIDERGAASQSRLVPRRLCFGAPRTFESIGRPAPSGCWRELLDDVARRGCIVEPEFCDPGGGPTRQRAPCALWLYDVPAVLHSRGVVSYVRRLRPACWLGKPVRLIRRLFPRRHRASRKAFFAPPVQPPARCEERSCRGTGRVDQIVPIRAVAGHMQSDRCGELSSSPRTPITSNVIDPSFRRLPGGSRRLWAHVCAQRRLSSQ